VIGSQVNLTSRIQSYTTGGQILISQTTRQEVGQILKLGRQMEVKAKGIEQPVTLFEVLWIGGSHKLLLPNMAEDLVPLAARIPLRYEIVDTSHLNGEVYNGTLTKLSRKEAEAHLDHPVPNLTNIKMHLLGKDSQEIPGSLYGKVVGLSVGGGNTVFSIRFTSVPPDIEMFLRDLLGSRTVEANDAATSIAADNALSASNSENAAANH
jgi:adenylate cyclase